MRPDGHGGPVRLELRPAAAHDAELLFDWTNEPGVRRWSFSSDPVPWAEHVAWLDQVLADPDRRLYVAELDGTPVGQARLDRGPDGEEISVSLAAAHRGAGLGVALIEAAFAESGGDVIAKVKVGNRASLAAFERAGFTRTAGGDGATVSLRRHRP